MWQDLAVSGTPIISSLKGLDKVISSAVLHCDATAIESYPGTGDTIYNIIAAPANGDEQGLYNHTRAGSKPSLVGTPGDAAAYWQFDGAGFFEVIAANTSFMKSIHKTTGASDFWLAIAFQCANVATFNTLLSTQTDTTTQGLSLEITSAVNLRQRGDTAETTYLGGVVANNTWTVAILSKQGAFTRRWINMRTKSIFTDNAFNTTTTDATQKMRIGSLNDITGFMTAGSRVVSWAFGNAFIDNADAVKIIDKLNANHGRTYV